MDNSLKLYGSTRNPSWNLTYHTNIVLLVISKNLSSTKLKQMLRLLGQEYFCLSEYIRINFSFLKNSTHEEYFRQRNIACQEKQPVFEFQMFNILINCLQLYYDSTYAVVYKSCVWRYTSTIKPCNQMIQWI